MEDRQALSLKRQPPRPGWIERLFAWGVAIAIPVTTVVGFALLVTARHQKAAGTRPAATSVLLAAPSDNRPPAIELRRPGEGAPSASPPGPAATTDCGALADELSRLDAARGPAAVIEADRLRAEARSRRCKAR